MAKKKNRHSSNPELEAIIAKLLRPLIRFCFRRNFNGISFSNLAKRIYLEVAAQELKTASPTVSQLHLATGIDRRVIKEIQSEPLESATGNVTASDLRGRIVAAWQEQRRFQNEDGSPRVLTCVGADSQFHKLCNSITQSINPSTVLFELERTGAVKNDDGKLTLVRYNSASLPGTLEGYDQIASDVELILESGSRNITKADKVAQLHIRTEFDNIYLDELPGIRIWLLEQGKEIHKKLRTLLFQADRDSSPNVGQDRPARGKVAFVTASLVQEPQEP